MVTTRSSRGISEAMAFRVVVLPTPVPPATSSLEIGSHQGVLDREPAGHPALQAHGKHALGVPTILSPASLARRIGGC